MLQSDWASLSDQMNIQYFDHISNVKAVNEQMT